MNTEDKKRFKEMSLYGEDMKDMPDGAFFALAEEKHGWDVDDWAWYSEACHAQKKNNLEGSIVRSGAERNEAVESYCRPLLTPPPTPT